ncbi:MAG: hypothetical protein R6V58_05940, partial [Planctomycetota bacterium]
ALFVVLALGLVAAGCGGGDTDEREPRKGGGGGPKEAPEPGVVTLTGTVDFHQAGVAIGGETDPSGYILTGDHAGQVEASLKKMGKLPETGLRDRVYLRRAGKLDHDRLEMLLNRKVKVTGKLDVVSAGGVETPTRHFPVLHIKELEAAE